MSDLGKISVTNEGAWNVNIPYEINTMVRHNNATYMSLKDSTGQEPSEENIEYANKAVDEYTLQLMEEGVI